MNLEQLDTPFPESDIEWRIQQSGKYGEDSIYAMVLAYVTNRAIMKRLDEVCGKDGWKNEYRPAPDSGVMCGISIRINNEWITKWDAAENTQVEAVKGGMSGAMKRAAVQWGIGRYLYNLTEGFATISKEKKDGWNRAKLKDGTVFYWIPPKIPSWALPSKDVQKHHVESPTSDDILKSFTEKTMTVKSVNELKLEFGKIWTPLNGTAQQTEAKNVYDIRKAELEAA
ncbi:MAG: Rad52/Rad22 family DNA repair protein [Sodalis sp. (in: enterobacteria)]|uniref:Rad52/Rad22 family DNA repair protein n=1 Tax=Sodalis sp. (in: enterobacteria) TaxID=1898979 RepID=UPI0039E6657B